MPERPARLGLRRDRARLQGLDLLMEFAELHQTGSWNDAVQWLRCAFFKRCSIVKQAAAGLAAPPSSLWLHFAATEGLQARARCRNPYRDRQLRQRLASSSFAFRERETDYRSREPDTAVIVQMKTIRNRVFVKLKPNRTARSIFHFCCFIKNAH